MVALGYSLLCEQRSPKGLVEDAVRAESAGFDFLTISDHFHPWLETEGHAGYAWSILGAVANATDNVGLTSYVTCPTIRYHPAMLKEAIEVIRKLWQGDYVSHHGTYFNVDKAKIFDLPETPVPIGVAGYGRMAAELGEFMVNNESNSGPVESFNQHGGKGKPVVGQPALCWGPDEQEARKTAHEQVPWSLGGWPVQAELPNPANFKAFSKVVSEEQVAAKAPCGPDLDKIVQSVKKYVDAGFTEVSLMQVGPLQAEFVDVFQRELGPELRKL